MSIDTVQLTNLRTLLQRLDDHLRQHAGGPDAVLEQDDKLVLEANRCDFMLPSPLTVTALRETVRKKLDNIDVLFDRAAVHESLPARAQEAAEDESAFIEADYDPAAAVESRSDTARS